VGCGINALVPLGESLNLTFLVRNPASNWVAAEPDSAPRYQVYDKDTANKAMPNGTGSASQRDTGTITNVVSNGGLCRVTSANHGLLTGHRVTISGVGGATGVNGTHTITQIDANTFDCQGSTFGGSYTSGGTWTVTGLYYAAIDFTAANGYASGSAYPIYVTYEISSTAYSSVLYVQVL